MHAGHVVGRAHGAGPVDAVEAVAARHVDVDQAVLGVVCQAGDLAGGQCAKRDRAETGGPAAGRDAQHRDGAGTVLQGVHLPVRRGGEVVAARGNGAGRGPEHGPGCARAHLAGLDRDQRAARQPDQLPGRRVHGHGAVGQGGRDRRGSHPPPAGRRRQQRRAATAAWCGDQQGVVALEYVTPVGRAMPYSAVEIVCLTQAFTGADGLAAEAGAFGAAEAAKAAGVIEAMPATSPAVVRRTVHGRNGRWRSGGLQRMVPPGVCR